MDVYLFRSCIRPTYFVRTKLLLYKLLMTSYTEGGTPDRTGLHGIRSQKREKEGKRVPGLMVVEYTSSRIRFYAAGGMKKRYNIHRYPIRYTPNLSFIRWYIAPEFGRRVWRSLTFLVRYQKVNQTQKESCIKKLVTITQRLRDYKISATDPKKTLLIFNKNSSEKIKETSLKSSSIFFFTKKILLRKRSA